MTKLLKSFDLFQQPAQSFRQASHYAYSRTFWIFCFCAFMLWVVFDLMLQSSSSRGSTAADRIVVDEGLWGSSVLFMNISMSQRHCSEVSWDQADHMDNIDLGMSQAVVHKIRLLPDGTEIPFEANPKNAPECIACPNALLSADATSTECCNDCLSLRRKFVASGLDVEMAAREAQCREGCRIEMYTDVLPVSGSVRHVVGESKRSRQGTDVTYNVDTDDILNFGAKLEHTVHNLEFVSNEPGARPLLAKDFAGPRNQHPATAPDVNSANSVSLLGKPRSVSEDIVAGAVRWVYSVQFVPVSVENREGTVSSYRYKLDAWPEPALAKDHQGQWSLVTTPGIFVLFRFEPFRLLHRQTDAAGFFSRISNLASCMVVLGGALSFYELIWSINRRRMKRSVL